MSFNTAQVHILVDDLDLANVNTVNLRAAVSAALLLLPLNFSEVCFYVTGSSFQMQWVLYVIPTSCRKIFMRKYAASHIWVTCVCFLLRTNIRCLITWIDLRVFYSYWLVLKMPKDIWKNIWNWILLANVK